MLQCVNTICKLEVSQQAVSHERRVLWPTYKSSKGNLESLPHYHGCEPLCSNAYCVEMCSFIGASVEIWHAFVPSICELVLFRGKLRVKGMIGDANQELDTVC